MIINILKIKLLRSSFLLITALFLLSFCTNYEDNQPLTFPSDANNLQSNIDVTFYHITLDINPDKKYYKGKVVCNFKVKSQTSLVSLDLNDELKVDRIQDEQGYLDFVQLDDKLHITFPEKLAKKKTQTITIHYGGKPQTMTNHAKGITKGLIYETHGNNEPIIATLSTPFLTHYWFPCNDNISDKVDSVFIDIILPNISINEIPLIAIANGKKEGELKLTNNRKIFKWRHRYPIAPCYIFFAVSNYKKHREIITTDFGNVQYLDFYLFKENYEASIPQMEKIKHVVKFFIEKFGKYPFQGEQLAFAEIGFYSGIETQTCAIVENFTSRRFYTMIHELAHIWFGNSVTAESWEHAWLHEGFATYAEVLWNEYHYGKKAYQTSIQKKAYYEGGTILSEPTDNPYKIFAGIMYTKGAYILHMLRGLVGDDIFFEILDTYIKRYQFSNATTADFIEVCEEVSEQNLDVFFEQWLYHEGYPIYNYSFYQNPKNLNITFNIRQSQLTRFYKYFEMPVQLLLDFEYKDTLITIQNDNFKQEFRFRTKQKLLNITLDPNELLLKKIGVRKQILEINNSSIYDVSFENSLSGRTVNLMLKSGKKQKAKFLLKDLDGKVVFEQYIKAGGTSAYTIDIPRNVLGGFYTMIVESKYERYYKDLIILN